MIALTIIEMIVLVFGIGFVLHLAGSHLVVTKRKEHLENEIKQTTVKITQVIPPEDKPEDIL